MTHGRYLAYIPALILLSSCGTTLEYQGVTTQGFIIFHDLDESSGLAPVDVEEISEVIEYTLDAYSEATGISRDDLLDAIHRAQSRRYLRIELFPHNFECGTKDLPFRTCSGLYWPGTTTIQVHWVNRRPWQKFCPSITSLSHEVIHHLSWLTLPSDERGHDNPKLFYSPESATRNAIWNHITDHCQWVFEDEAPNN